MKKRHVMFFMLAFFIIIPLLAACGNDSSEEGLAENGTTEETETDNNESNSEEGSDLEGTITMAGSTSVQPLSEELAAVFMELHPETRLEVSGGGSGAGVTAAQESAADFGAVSREIKDEETGITAEVIAIDGIAIIAHPDNSLTDIALEDVTKIFAGEITNWSEVGGDDQDIVVVSREDGSGTRGAFTDIVLGDEELVESALIHNSTGGVLEAVANDPNAIGYASTGAVSDSVVALAVDGFEPTLENIQSGDYAVSRPFNYAMNEDAELSELAQAFLDFVLSDEGQKVVEENGFIPVN
ncbi:phosphate transport system substrate-binding protein [Gracilibacillus halotolerans]|uniref:Phosphate-binding protein n=1 Tax=Gracilibacillus halotolerans TaxID=74386 RepID=A0A841RQU0_9BACI|nr:phosphate ABC transporter substrate-binding protein [Gracilibacillus halotolerans]MBB6513294.1 phosphate transport system substrate-binding protein [Gracilibacillus halotolerans]